MIFHTHSSDKWIISPLKLPKSLNKQNILPYISADISEYPVPEQHITHKLGEPCSQVGLFRAVLESSKLHGRAYQG